MNDNTATDQVSRLRGGYRPTEAELSAWNVASVMDGLRHEISESDLPWIMPAIAEDDGSRAAFHLALLQPLATRPDVRDVLVRRFGTASPYLKSQLLWRLLDDADLSGAIHEDLFQFVLSDWESFQSSSVSFLGSPSEILAAALGRLAECIPSKRWIYLCCLPQYAADQRPVKGLLSVASGSADAFTSRVAVALLARFF